MAYTNPGKLFLDKHGPVETEDDVLNYAQFLREEAAIVDEIPVDLHHIFSRFDIPVPQRVALPDQQGLLVNPKKGIILINEGDLLVRQRFTEAHELMELLFASLPTKRSSGMKVFGNFLLQAKEKMCDRGAAELLMPRSSFVERVKTYGVSFQTAQRLALEYYVSRTAALVNMALFAPGMHAVILWKNKNKKSELKNEINPAQLSMLFDMSPSLPPKRMRIEWSFVKSDTLFFPEDKSAAEDSCICTAASQGVFTEGREYLDFGRGPAFYYVENWPFRVDEDVYVLSLLHLPGDDACALSPYSGS